MTRKGRRLVLIGSAVGMLAIAAGLMMFAFRDNIVFFYGPSELAQKQPAPGARLPSTFLRDGSALYDRLGPWFTLLCFGEADPSPIIDASPAPLEIVIVDDPSLAAIYEATLVLVRPDTHVAWRGNACTDGDAVWAKVLQ